MSGDGTGIGGHLLKKTINAIKVVVDAINAVVGTNADGHSVNTLSGKVKQLLEHIHSIAMIHPELANPVSLQKASGAWAAYGTPTEIVAAGAITEDFDLHFGIISEISANGDYTVEIYQGAALSETQIAHISVSRNAVQSQEGTIPIITPLLAGDTRISAALSSGNAAQDTLKIKLMYHTY